MWEGLTCIERPMKVQAHVQNKPNDLVLLAMMARQLQN